MPLRRAAPIAVGTDICQVSRVRNLISCLPDSADDSSPNSSNTDRASELSRPLIRTRNSGRGRGFPRPPPPSPPTGPAIDQARLKRLTRRIFSVRELSGFQLRWAGNPVGAGPLPPGLDTFLAGRWAAKEAAVKAASVAGLGRVSLHQVLLSSRPGPVRCAILSDAAVLREASFEFRHGDTVAAACAELADAAAAGAAPPPGVLDEDDAALAAAWARVEDWAELEGQEGSVSVAHDGEYAFATCLLPRLLSS